MKPLIILSALLTSTLVWGQTLLEGRVVDAKDLEPLIGASVYLVSDFSVGTVTDVNGRFVLHSPVKPSDSLLISFMGYEEQLIGIPLVEDEVLLQERALHMSEVKVTAAPLVAEEFKYVSVSKLGIYTNPAAKADPLLAITSMPSSTTTDESAAISLRGSSPVETGIFLNNVPVYNAVKYAQLNGIGSFSLFNTALIKRVDVFPGNPPVEYGNSTAGVVSITTDESSINSNTNSIVVSPANVGYQRNQRIGEANLRFFTNYQPGAVLKWMNPSALRSINRFRSTDGGAYLQGMVHGKLSYKLYSYLLSEDYAYKYEHPTFVGEFLQNRFQTMSVANLAVRWQGCHWSWNQGYTLGKRAFEYSASVFEVLTKSLYQSLVISRASEKWQSKIGISLDASSSEISGTFFSYDYAVGDSLPTYELHERIKTPLVEVYGYSKYYFSERLMAGMGVRKNLNSAVPRDYISGQMNVAYTLASKWKLIAGMGRYYKYGMSQDLATSVFIKSDQVSMDVFYGGSTIDASGSLFLKNNEINGAFNRLFGVEVFAQGRLAAHWLVDGSYTYLIPQETTVNAIGYFVKSNIRFEPGNWTFALNTLFRQGTPHYPVTSTRYEKDLHVFRPLYADRSFRLPDYLTTNLSISRLLPVSEKLSMVAFASLSNITDRKNVRSYVYNFDYSQRSGEYLGRRTVYLGMQVSFQ